MNFSPRLYLRDFSVSMTPEIAKLWSLGWGAQVMVLWSFLLRPLQSLRPPLFFVRFPFILSASCTPPSQGYLQCLGFKSSLPGFFALAVCSAEKAVSSPLLISDLCWVFSLNILSSRRLSWLCGRQNKICSPTPHKMSTFWSLEPVNLSPHMAKGTLQVWLRIFFVCFGHAAQLMGS